MGKFNFTHFSIRKFSKIILMLGIVFGLSEKSNAQSDECGTAIELFPSSGSNITNTTGGDNISATASSQTEPSCYSGIEDDVWFKFTATATTHLVGITEASLGDNFYYGLGMSVYSGTCGSLNELDCKAYTYEDFFGVYTDPIQVSSLNIGETYYVRVWTSEYDSELGVNFSIGVSSPTPPPNDFICNAITLTVDGASDCQNTLIATSNDDPGDINNCSTPNNTVWYKFTPSVSGKVLVNIENTASGDPLHSWLFMYSVTDPCGTPGYTQIPFINDCQEGSDDLNGSLTSSLSGTLTAGQTYYIILDGNSGDVGEYCISIATAPPPPNCVTNISPANAATNIIVDGASDPSFSWNAASGATSYDIYLGTTPGGETNIGNETGTTTTISGLNVNTTYYWYAVPVGPGGPAAGCVSNEFTFTTSPATMPPDCTYLNSPDDAGLVGNFPTLNWGEADFATSYNIYLDMNATPTTLYGNTTQTQFTGSTALPQGTYYWYVQPVNAIGAATGCSGSLYSFTVMPSPSNDVPTNAVTLNVGQPCTGNSFTNEFANHNPGEPYPNCQIQSEGEHSVWFKFLAPTSGSVKITTDIGTLGTLSDTKIGLFQVGEDSNYSSFNLIACDDDNGIIGSGYTSTIFATDLIGNQFYYVEVDGYGSGDQGTFCLEVSEINPTMIANAASCTNLQTPLGNNEDYTGWVTLLDENGKLVANVRNSAGGEASNYSGSYNIDQDGFQLPRQDATGRYYLSRNYMISNSDITTPVDVRFYFHFGEMAVLSGVTSNGTTISNLNVTKQESNNCNADFADANGTTSLLTQTANGSTNAVSWVQVTTSSFSNFYLMGGTTPLIISLSKISAENKGRYNLVKWTTAKEDAGDYFELERSNDGKNFSFLAKVAANQKASDYTFQDNNPLENVNYYRLKLINKDGKFIYSQVVEASVLTKNAFTVDAFPNPAKNNINIKVQGSENGAVTLTDIAGRTISQTKVNGTELNMDLSKLDQGVYFIKYTDNNLTKTIKINKQ